MAIRKREGKRGVSYQIDYLDPNGKRVRQSFKKKGEAVAELGKRVSLIGEKRYLDVKKDYRSTLGELVSKYEEDYQSQRGFKAKKCFLKNIKEHFGNETRLSNLHYVNVEDFYNDLRRKLTKCGTLRRNGSVNREMSCLHHLCRCAVEWDMVERSPFEGKKRLWLKENNKRTRFLAEDEIGKLLKECEGRKHLYRVVMCALHTGMRKGEILSLRWNQIKDGFIYLKNTKTDEPRQIPVNDTLAASFREIRREQGLSSEYVFTYRHNDWKARLYKGRMTPVKERPFTRIWKAFKAAAKRAGIEDCRFHDLRHTFASHLVMKGASLKEVQELLGHENLKMTMRYAHLGDENKKKAVNLLNELTTYVKTDMSQTCHKSESAPLTVHAC